MNPQNDRDTTRCQMCGGVAHAASGSQYTPRVIVCGPCTREFWEWVCRHQANAWFRAGANRPNTIVNFYSGEVRERRPARQAQ